MNSLFIYSIYKGYIVSEIQQLDEYVQQQQVILSELTNIERKDFDTKRNYIIRLKEVTKPLIENGYYDGLKSKDLATKIYELLQKNNVSYPRNDSYYSLFDLDEKREEKNPMSTSGRQEISPLPIEKQTGNEVIDRLKAIERSGFTLPETKQYDYLRLIDDTSNETNKQVKSIIEKYGKALAYSDAFEKQFNIKELKREIESLVGKKKQDLQERYDYYIQAQETIFNIEDSLDNVLEKEVKLKEIHAEQKHISRQLDERNKISFIEKWNIILCERCESMLGISAIAKRLGIDKKHISNNIKPTHNPVTDSPNKHHEYINWFRNMNITTPKGEVLVFDMKDWADKQIERKKLNLPFENLVLKTCDVA